MTNQTGDSRDGGHSGNVNIYYEGHREPSRAEKKRLVEVANEVLAASLKLAGSEGVFDDFQLYLRRIERIGYLGIGEEGRAAHVAHLEATRRFVSLLEKEHLEGVQGLDEQIKEAGYECTKTKNTLFSLSIED